MICDDRVEREEQSREERGELASRFFLGIESESSSSLEPLLAPHTKEERNVRFGNFPISQTSSPGWPKGGYVCDSHSHEALE